MKPAEILHQLIGAYQDKAALRGRHVAVACVVGQYDINNTYQYVIAREDEHLRWLADAIVDLGGVVPDAPVSQAGPPVKGEEAVRPVVGDDAQGLDAFVGAWRPRAATITNARQRRMLELMLGETQEQARLFHQAAAGRLDLLGRRTGGDRLAGSVLPTRWVE